MGINLQKKWKNKIVFAFFATLRKGIWGTPKGPLGHPEVATVGLDDLQQRCQQAGVLQAVQATEMEMVKHDQHD